MSCYCVNSFDFTLEKLQFFPRENRTNQHSSKTCFFCKIKFCARAGEGAVIKLYHWCIANKLIVIKPILYFAIWKRGLFPGIVPALQQRWCKLTWLNLYSIKDFCLMQTCIGMHFQSCEKFRLTTDSKTALHLLYLFANMVWNRILWMMCQRNHIKLSNHGKFD